MHELETLAYAVYRFAGLTEEDFKLSLPYWQTRKYKKGEFFNEHGHICQYMGFITEGVFRSYIINSKTADEKNIFLYPTGAFVVTFRSFIHKVPCDYHTQAITDATTICISHDDLQRLYQLSHKWETFGRRLAEEAFDTAIDRAEGMLFKTPEERYLDLADQHPDIFNSIPLYHISSYLGIQAPSLSRIRKRLSNRRN